MTKEADQLRTWYAPPTSFDWSAGGGGGKGRIDVGVDIGSWAVVSGRPVANGGKVRLDELRIDSVDDPTLQLVLESGLLPSLPRAVDLDVLAAVRSMLQNTGANLQTSVDAFQIDSVQVGGARLAVRFDFKLLAR